MPKVMPNLMSFMAGVQLSSLAYICMAMVEGYLRSNVRVQSFHSYELLVVQLDCARILQIHSSDTHNISDPCLPRLPGNLSIKKDGLGNPMISAHLSGQIFANIETGPYCFMGEEAFHMLAKCAL